LPIESWAKSSRHVSTAGQRTGGATSICPLCVERKSFNLEGAACIALMGSVICRLAGLKLICQVNAFNFGQLCKLDVPSIYRCVQRHYLHAGFRPVLSGIDLALDSRTHAKPFWEARIISVVVRPRTKDLMRSMNDFYPQSTWRELQRQDLGEALFSTIQPVFYQDETDGSSENLQPPQIQELAHCLARYDMSVRYSLVGCHRDNGWIKRIEMCQCNYQNPYPLAIEIRDERGATALWIGLRNSGGPGIGSQGTCCRRFLNIVGKWP
jgi:hypothetical protein